jgi:hypothetical protein
LHYFLCIFVDLYDLHYAYGWLNLVCAAARVLHFSAPGKACVAAALVFRASETAPTVPVL